MTFFTPIHNIRNENAPAQCFILRFSAFIVWSVPERKLLDVAEVCRHKTKQINVLENISTRSNDVSLIGNKCDFYECSHSPLTSVLMSYC